MKRSETYRQKCIRLNDTINGNPEKYELKENIRQRMIERFFPAHLITSKTRSYCSSCGGEVRVLTQTECPHCHKKLGKPEHADRPSRHWEREYLCVMNVMEGLQVMRFWCFEYHLNPGHKTNYFVSEVERQFIRNDGERQGFAKGTQAFAYNCDAWCFYKPITIKPLNKRGYYGSKIDARFDLPCEATIVKSVIPILRRNGLKYSMHGIWHPVYITLGLLKDPEIEWLWKIGQYNMAVYVAEHYIGLDKDTAAAIRICHRNHYTIEDPNLWLEHIKTLQKLNLDVHNAKYVCVDQDELRRKHEEMVLRLQRKREKEEAERRAKREAELAKMQLHWSEHFAKILPLSLKADNLSIRPLQSIDEFKSEGKAMHHCVFAMRYYDYNEHPNSLILSAKDGKGERLATIEYDTKKLSIVQCRAACNAVPERDKEIRRLINSHKAEIVSLLKAA